MDSMIDRVAKSVIGGVPEDIRSQYGVDDLEKKLSQIVGWRVVFDGVKDGEKRIAFTRDIEPVDAGMLRSMFKSIELRANVYKGSNVWTSVDFQYEHPRGGNGYTIARGSFDAEKNTWTLVKES
jgi:hypothetical protein